MSEPKVGPVTPCAECCPCVGDAGPRPATCYERVAVPTLDAVAQAREKYDELISRSALADEHAPARFWNGPDGKKLAHDLEAAWAEVIAAVRAECAAKVLGLERYEPCESPTFGGTYADMRSTRKRKQMGDGEWLNRHEVLAAIAEAAP